MESSKVLKDHSKLVDAGVKLGTGVVLKIAETSANNVINSARDKNPKIPLGYHST